MLYPLFQTIRYFSVAIFCYFFNLKNNKPLYYSGKLLVTKSSFRLPDYARSDPFTGLRVLKRALSQTWANPLKIHSLSASNVAIYDGSARNIKLRQDYIGEFRNKNTGYFIAKEELVAGENIWHKLMFSVFFIFCFASVAPLTVFSAFRTNYALIFPEIIECANLLYLLKKHQIKELHYFCPYEKDTNICAYVLMKDGIYVYKYPSPSPLRGHNKTLIASCLVLTTGYQEEEYQQFKDTIIVDETKKWMPENALNYVERYLHSPLKTVPNTIGFYSHGLWLRAKRKQKGALASNHQADEILLTYLSEYMKNKPNIKFLIYPHPKEIKAEVFDETCAFYSKIFSGKCDFEFAKNKTHDSFEQVDVAISSYSTVIFERLFCGFKSLIFSYGVNNFPIKGSSLSNICFEDQATCFNYIDKTIQQSNEQFFESNKIKNYKFFGIEKLQRYTD